MKNVVMLQHYYFPWELEAAVGDFVAYYDNERYRESLDNVMPADVYYGCHYAMISERTKIKRLTMQRRRKEYLAGKAARAETGNRLLARTLLGPEYFDDLNPHAPRPAYR